MKKTGDINTPLEKNISEKNLNVFKTKTTNVNILLNRVRIEKKNNLKKKIIFTSIIILLLGLAIIITIV
tara:strand:+ start:321 stop:527 length:207 start_codon:yes stop_codon:yes gene_type:complete